MADNASKIRIAPSILSADFADMATALGMLERCGADMIHCDVMDGVFVPNITFGAKMIADIRKRTKLPLDVHLMIVEPERYVEEFARAGADIITVHLEAVKDAKAALQMIRGKGAKCGLVISPDTPAQSLLPYLHLCDMVLVMSVYPGFGGQKFIPSALDKLRVISDYAATNGIKSGDEPLWIEVDGGVSAANAAEIKAAGANVLVAGNAVFSACDPRAVVEGMRRA